MARKYVIYATKEKIEKINKKNKEHIRKYFVSKNMNLSEVSKKSYESDFNQWLVYIMENYENVDLLSLDVEDTADMIEDYIAFCSSILGNNERRIQRRMSSISSFYLNLKKKRKIESNPLDYLDRPKVGKGEKLQIKQTFLTKSQIEEIRKGLKQIGKTQLELYFELSLSTMARVNAISNIKLEQIDLKNRKINDVLEKEGYIVTLFPSERTVALIKKWIKERENEGIECKYLFVVKHGGKWKKVEKITLQQSWIKQIGNIVSIPELHPHDLRHSGSNLLKDAGMTLEDISKLLNHKSTQTTIDHYLQVNYDKIAEAKSKYEI
ncbi:recombinase XerD (plasmid) [Paenibacillus larvae subsp. pulvifaciens]|uniref:Recombinase XerD n=1 Tax=Paenibacillus larvae subsp. pulvifaciens TaxID=1477 RepID=A0A1V0V028_9BACL|nr:tyrosine-type recombinase/integrase [Paenibacillus larvae]ARF70777.1 recombinase XerD [Paenibacillus larvae subsp. pulvifaciens]